MAVGCGRDVNVVDAPVRESGRGFPPRGCVQRTWRENGNIPAAMGGIPWPLVADETADAADGETGNFGSVNRCLYFISFFMRTDLGARTTLMAIGNMVSAGLSRLIQESHVIATVWRDRRK